MHELKLGVKNIKNKLTKIEYNREIIYLIVLFLFLFFACNYITITHHNWVVHPSEAEALFFSKEKYDIGTFTMERNVYGTLPDPVFVRSFGVFIDNKIVPRIAYGIIFISTIGQIFGIECPFFLCSVLNLIGLLFLYLLIRNVYNKKIACFSTFLFSVSFPFIFWNNMLYGNLLGFSFFVIGLYFVSKIVIKDKTRLINYLLATVFFSFLVWTRYEGYIYLLFTIPYLLFIYRKKINFIYFIISILLFLSLIFPYFILNNQFYGSPFTIGYVEKTTRLGETQTTSEIVPGGLFDNLINGANRIYNSFPLLRIGFFKERGIAGGIIFLFNNIKSYIYNIYTLPTLLGIMGFFMSFRKRDISPFIIPLILLSIFLIYFEGASYHWGFDQPWVSSFYSRYWFVVYATLSIFASYFLINLNRKINFSRKYKVVVINAILIIVIFSSMNTTFYASEGLTSTANSKNSWYNLEQWAKTTPDDSIIVSGYFSKIIYSRDVLNPLEIPGAKTYDPMFHTITNGSDEEKTSNTLLNYTQQLIKRGHNVYLVEWVSHKGTYLNLPAIFLKNNNFQLEEIKSPVNGVKIYKVHIAD